MGKVVLFLLFGAFAQIALLLFGGGSTGTESGILLSSENSTTSFTDIVVRPDTWYSNPLFTFLSSSFSQFLVAGALLVGALFFRNERVIYLGISAVFLTFIAPIINLWQFMGAQGIFGGASLFLMALFISPLIALAIGTILDFSQGKD